MTDRKVLFFDIETTPFVCYSWQLWDASIPHVIRNPHVMSIAYRWGHQKRVNLLKLPDYDGFSKDPTSDVDILEEFSEVIGQADYSVAHNTSFDSKMIRGRMFMNGLPPFATPQEFCTYRTAKRLFKLPRYRLDDIGRYLGVGRKDETGGIKLWVDCMEGSKSAWDKMGKYNKQDVALLEKVYQGILPWTKLTLFDSGCPRCGSLDITTHQNRVTAAGAKYRQYRCHGCGSFPTDRKQLAGFSKNPLK